MKSQESFKTFGFDKTLFFATLGLLLTGLLMVFSASGHLAMEKYRQPFHFLTNQAAGAVAGMVLVFILLSVKKPFYQNPYLVYGLLLLTVILLALCFVMPPIARTNRWVQLFGLRFQPSELAKVSLVLFLSFYLERKKDKLEEIPSILFPIFVLGLIVLLVLKEPDYGTALLILVICAVTLYVGGVRLRYLTILGIISAALFGFYLFQSSYRIDRVAGFISPEKDPLGKGFQVIQSKLAVGSGGLLGVSLGESTQKLFFVPYAHTDFIFAIIGEEFGLLGTLTILSLFLIFLWRGLTISIRAPTMSARLLAFGLTLMIVVQALLNISISLGLGPAKGAPLPFISFGRSSLVCNLVAVGMLLNISQRKGYGLKIP